MDKETLHLWFAYPDDLMAEDVAEACVRLLNAEELSRLKAFKFERHRREYLATRALQRTALSALRPIAHKDWQFEMNAHGKPATKPDCGLRFNLSNSLGLVVCLVSEKAEVGVDVESHQRARQIMEVAPRVFSPRELEQLERLEEHEKQDRALTLWTLKEAYIKARGMGLALPLKQISFQFDGDGRIRLELGVEVEDRAARWKFCLLNQAGHRIALMAEAGPQPNLEVLEARPLLGAGNPLPAGGVQWFPA